ncbi:DgyrCDS46 [Dimorphilus gyrociliatus]|uniref:DgyrCDS46 n=1 Tax=Dimorphilus gyrociliatus TaxID=2664684 RepID=A0A7I8V3G5_9ANNE|nr:DgyrCDS46 [Dimorphilus gyrociliatus]
MRDLSFATCVFILVLTVVYGQGNFIGCKFSDSLCKEDERCFDDALFGTCQSRYGAVDIYKYDLTPSAVDVLQRQLQRLIEEKYTWKSIYTQCTILNFLLAFRTNSEYDEDFCDRKRKEKLEEEELAYYIIKSLEREKNVGSKVDSYDIEKEETLLPDLDTPISDSSWSSKPSGIESVNREQLNDDSLIADDSNSIRDAYLLNSLLQGDIDVSQLSNDEVDRLSVDVDKIIESITADKQKEKGESEVLPEWLDEDKPEMAPANEFDSKLEQNPVISNGEGYKTLKATEDEIENEVKKRVNSNAEIDIPKDPHDHGFENSMVNTHTEGPKYAAVDLHYTHIVVKPAPTSREAVDKVMWGIMSVIGLNAGDLRNVTVEKDGTINFLLDSNLKAHTLGKLLTEGKWKFKNLTGIELVEVRFGEHSEVGIPVAEKNGPKYFVLTFVTVGIIAGLVVFVVIFYAIRQHSRSKEKLKDLTKTDATGKDYEELCRHRMQCKATEKPEPLNATVRTMSTDQPQNSPAKTESRSSTSSWSEEPVHSNMDITTGHIVLSYMEDHLKNKEKVDEEWEALCSYEAEPNSCSVGMEHSRNNRFADILPYNHSRVVLNASSNVSGIDYINASCITDHDPRNPAYIATQGPLAHTVADFWQMVWEQGAVTIVNLTELGENLCHRYWPEEGSDLYNTYEVHLVSEHMWSDDYVVRSFYLKNIQTNETRTVSQFHYLTWPELGVPHSVKSILDFRRKVNKSYKARSCPIVVHCSDGAGRTGGYCLLDLVLNRLAKGAKEIDIAASLEHIRDQRLSMVKTKEQFTFILASVAEEVHAILKALPQ